MLICQKKYYLDATGARRGTEGSSGGYASGALAKEERSKDLKDPSPFPNIAILPYILPYHYNINTIPHGLISLCDIAYIGQNWLCILESVI